MPNPTITQRPAPAPDRLVQFDEEGSDNPWALQREYMDWRRSQGLEPPADCLNRWELAMDRIGDPVRSVYR